MLRISAWHRNHKIKAHEQKTVYSVCMLPIKPHEKIGFTWKSRRYLCNVKSSSILALALNFLIHIPGTDSSWFIFILQLCSKDSVTHISQAFLYQLECLIQSSDSPLLSVPSLYTWNTFCTFQLCSNESLALLSCTLLRRAYNRTNPVAPSLYTWNPFCLLQLCSNGSVTHLSLDEPIIAQILWHRHYIPEILSVYYSYICMQ